MHRSIRCCKTIRSPKFLPYPDPRSLLAKARRRIGVRRSTFRRPRMFVRFDNTHTTGCEERDRIHSSRTSERNVSFMRDNRCESHQRKRRGFHAFRSRGASKRADLRRAETSRRALAEDRACTAASVRATTTGEGVEDMAERSIADDVPVSRNETR